MVTITNMTEQTQCSLMLVNLLLISAQYKLANMGWLFVIR